MKTKKEKESRSKKGLVDKGPDQQKERHPEGREVNSHEETLNKRGARFGYTWYPFGKK